MEFNFSLVPYLQKRNFPFVGLTYAPAEGINVGRDPKAKSTERQLQLSMRCFLGAGIRTHIHPR